MIKREGKGNITASIVAHSRSSVDGKEIITWELVYPRFIHGELMTHRLFSRNAASSRAIPVEKMIQVIKDTPAMPVHWGKNQPGMQANEECFEEIKTLGFDDGEIVEITKSREEAWKDACYDAIGNAKNFHEAGYHKQIVNRLLEPFQMMKTIVTATEFDNWYWLRNHNDAQPEIRELAKTMNEAYDASMPEELSPGEWHTPYVDHNYGGNPNNSIGYHVYDANGGIIEVSLEEALKISSSCCAQVSYRILNDSLDKALIIYDRLVTSKPVHASPMEHQATPMKQALLSMIVKLAINDPFYPETWQEGVTHFDRSGDFWSGNFRGWIQHRQLIPGNVKNDQPLNCS